MSSSSALASIRLPANVRPLAKKLPTHESGHRAVRAKNCTGNSHKNGMRPTEGPRRSSFGIRTRFGFRAG